MRAILLASATAATLNGRRASRRVAQSAALRAALCSSAAARWRRAPGAAAASGCPASRCLPRRSLPPLECGFGVRPSQAAKWRAEAKPPGSGDERLQRGRGDRADAGDGGQPPCRFVLASAADHRAVETARSASLAGLDLSARVPARLPAPASGRRSSSLSRTTAMSSADLPDPLRRDDAELGEVAAQRVHASRALPHQQVARTFSSTAAACCSSVLTGTKRIVGRVTASQIASASAASVLPRLT